MTVLKYQMIEQGLNADSLSRKLLKEKNISVTGSSIRRYAESTTALRLASHETVLAIAETLGVTIEKLFADFDIIISE
jgi:hypothetical protein